jgi:hypothetical protein
MRELDRVMLFSAFGGVLEVSLIEVTMVSVRTGSSKIALRCWNTMVAYYRVAVQKLCSSLCRYLDSSHGNPVPEVDATSILTPEIDRRCEQHLNG